MNSFKKKKIFKLRVFLTRTFSQKHAFVLERVVVLDGTREGHTGHVKGLSWDPIGMYLASQVHKFYLVVRYIIECLNHGRFLSPVILAENSTLLKKRSMFLHLAMRVNSMRNSMRYPKNLVIKMLCSFASSLLHHTLSEALKVFFCAYRTVIYHLSFNQASVPLNCVT